MVNFRASTACVGRLQAELHVLILVLLSLPETQVFTKTTNNYRTSLFKAITPKPKLITKKKGTWASITGLLHIDEYEGHQRAVQTQKTNKTAALAMCEIPGRK